MFDLKGLTNMLVAERELPLLCFDVGGISLLYHSLKLLILSLLTHLLLGLVVIMHV